MYFNHFRDGETEVQGSWLAYPISIGQTWVLTPVILTHCLITVDCEEFPFNFAMTHLVTTLWVVIYNFHIVHGFSTAASDIQIYPEEKPK